MKIVKRALLADDHSLYREGLALLLKEHFSYSEILGSASLAEASAVLDRQPNIELALFDLAMPGMDGARSLAPLRSLHRKTKFAIVSASETKNDVLDALAIGLNGFIPKTLPIPEFVAAVSTILAGRVYVPGLMIAQDVGCAQRTYPSYPGRDDGESNAEKNAAVLTTRQKEVLECVRIGMSNRDIAEKLGISTGTVKLHVTALLTAHNFRNRVQLVSPISGLVTFTRARISGRGV